MRSGWKRAALACLFMAGLSSSLLAADKITIMVSGIDKLIYLPAKLADRLGYLKETGLDVELLSEAAGSNAETEMLSGVAQGVIGFYDHTISLQARGKPVQSVIQLTLTPGEAILVSQKAATEIRSVADLNKKVVGVTGLGSSTYHLTRHIVAKAGLKPTDYRIIPVGGGSSFSAAISKSEIDAGMTTEPTVSRLLAAGTASLLVDLRTAAATSAALGGPYPGACLYMPTSWVGKNEDKVRKITGALVKSLRYIHEHTAEEVAAQLPESFFGNDRALYVRVLEASKPMFSPDGLMPDGGPATVLEVLKTSEKSVQTKPVNLANTYTNRFVAPAVR